MPPIKEDYLLHSREKAEAIVAVLLSTLTVSRAWVKFARINNEAGYAVGVTLTEQKGGDQFWFNPQIALAASHIDEVFYQNRRIRGSA